MFTGIEVEFWTIVCTTATDIEVIDSADNVITIALSANVPISFRSVIKELKIVTTTIAYEFNGEKIL